MPDILIYKNVYARQFDEVAQTGSVEDLNTVSRFAKDSVLRVMAPWLLEFEQKAREKIEERENKERREGRLAVTNNFGENVNTVNISATG